MIHRLINSAMIAAFVLLTVAVPAVAADKKPEAPAATGDVAKRAAKPTEAAKKAVPPAKIKLVDINSAKTEELKTLPEIGDAEAGRIIAGRPYGSKAHLVTKNILSREVYEKLKKQVIARQK